MAKHIKEQPATLTSSEVAKMLGTTPRTVCRMASSGILPYVQIGTWRRYDPKDIEALLEQCTFEKGGN